jgi:hypothetical protein
MPRVKNARGIIWSRIKDWHIAQKNDFSFKGKKENYKMIFSKKDVEALIQVMQDYDQLQRVLTRAQKEVKRAEKDDG